VPIPGQYRGGNPPDGGPTAAIVFGKLPILETTSSDVLAPVDVGKLTPPFFAEAALLVEKNDRVAEAGIQGHVERHRGHCFEVDDRRAGLIAVPPDLRLLAGIVEIDGIHDHRHRTGHVVADRHAVIHAAEVETYERHCRHNEDKGTHGTPSRVRSHCFSFH
jgi:hypothetical protein